MGKYWEKFIDPDFSSYPEARWWLAQGYHTDQTLEDSVQQLYDMGFRACEVLTLTEYSIDRQLYGWGSEEFNHDMLTIAKKATKLGMGFSFTSGPDWQPAIPGLDVNSEACGQELNFTNVNVKAGESFSGELKPYQHLEPAAHIMEEIMGEGIPKGPDTSVLPEAGDIIQKYVRTVAVKLADPADIDKVDLNAERYIPPAMPFGPDVKKDSFETIYFTRDSAIDLTPQVTEKDNKYCLEWTAPDDGNYVVLTFWRHATTQVADSACDTAFCINHLDRRGPEAQKEYWNRHILTPEMKDVILENGDVDFFQDSLEIRTLMAGGLWWCEDFLQEFESRRGYSLTPYLPVIIHYGICSMMEIDDDSKRPRFDYAGSPGLYEKVMDDLHLTQTDLYRENYLQPVREWLNGVGIKLRAQASYGSPWVAFEMTLAEDSLDLQETETLEMNDVIDYYRTHSGGVHMYQMPRYSAETGAIGGMSYAVPLKHYMWQIHRLYAGGVNRVITHGYSAISGPDATTKWPGYDGIGFVFSERWGLRHPYGSMARDFTTYLARLQTALRAGSAKVDIGILNLMFHSPDVPLMHFGGDRNQDDMYFWKDQNLAKAGYTYDFFAPQYLERGFKCENGLFDAGNTDYKAIIVYQKSIPVDSAKSLLAMAKAGLPVVVAGDAGSEGFGVTESAGEVKAVMAELKSLPNTACCADVSGIAAALASIGVRPRAAFHDPVSFYSVIREGEGEKYLYIMNAGDTDARTDISVEGEYTPVSIDCWTGNISRVGVFKIAGGRTVLSVSLKAGDAALYALEPDNGALHIVSTDACPAISGSGASFASFESGKYTAVLSDGVVSSVEINVPDAPCIEKWKVIVEDWKEGEKKEIMETRCGHTTTEYYYETVIDEIVFETSELKAWKDIPEVGKNVSGIGRYSATFTLASDWSSENGLILDLGTLHEMAQVTINGVKAQCANMMDPEVDVSKFINPGENTLEIVISTTLVNRLIEMGRYQPGAKGIFSDMVADYQDYGLTSCTLRPYTKTNAG